MSLEGRKQLVDKFQKWLDTKPEPGIIAAECATIAETHSQQRVNEVLDKAAEKIFNTPIDKGKPDCYLGGYGDALNDTQQAT